MPTEPTPATAMREKLRGDGGALVLRDNPETDECAECAALSGFPYWPCYRGEKHGRSA